MMYCQLLTDSERKECNLHEVSIVVAAFEQVFEGEHRITDKNRKLGEFSLTNIEPGPAVRTQLYAPSCLMFDTTISGAC